MHPLPERFLESLRSLGHEAYDNLPEVIMASAPSVSVRLNPRRPVVADGLETVAWNPDGRYLEGRPAFTLDPRLHQGRYYVQDASSMAVRAAVEAADVEKLSDDPLKVLDACAAPGGKTTALIDALPADAFVVANEYDPRRAQILAENLAKWGMPAVVTRGDAALLEFPGDFFDIIAADVPCSGEGMMRKDAFAIEQWSERLVDDCAGRQRAIVANLWKALKPGGYFIYSTCTYNLKENEHIIEMLIENQGGEPVEMPLDYPGILPAMGGYDFPAYRFVPGAVKGEGLFIAMLRKPSGATGTKMRKFKPQKGIKKAPLELAEYLKGDFSVIDGAAIQVVPTMHVPYYAEISKVLRPLCSGIETGSLKGKDFIPSQALALSAYLRNDAFARCEVDNDTAVDYLRRQAIVLPAGTPRGVILLTFEGYPLGFVKNLGNRANNLYPEHWRIRN